MDDGLLRLADLKYHKFQELIDREIRSKESNLISAWAAKGISGGPSIKAILDLSFEKAKTLYRKRIEIEKELFLNKYGYLPDPMMEQLKKTARGIIAREMRILSEHGFWKSHRFGSSIVLEKIREKEISLGLKLDRDIEIEKGEDKLRSEKEERKSLEEKKREQFLNEDGNSLIETFKLRDQVNLMFKEKFNFEIFKLKQEKVFLEIAKPCKNEEDFVRKILVLGNLIDWMDVDNLKSRLKVKLKDARSIKLLEEFLKENVGSFDPIIIQNFKDIIELRNKKFPVHTEGEEIIRIMNKLGIKYPPKNWNLVWESVMALYKDSLDALIKLMS